MKLYGVDAPDLNQVCLTKRGEQYACGKTAQNKLKKLLLNKKIDCQIVGQDQNNFYLTTCVIQGYDVGATMVSVGWAVAERHISQVYIPYEQQAHRAHEGLWAGKFMAPWEFRERLQHSHNSQSGGVNAGNFFKGIFQ